MGMHMQLHALGPPTIHVVGGPFEISYFCNERPLACQPSNTINEAEDVDD